MTYEMYHSIFVMSGIFCGVMLAVTIVLFFVLKVSGLIGYFTGAAERKAVENIRQQNERSDSRALECDPAVHGRVNVTGKISSSVHLPRETEPLIASGQVSDETFVLSQQERPFEVEYEICYIHSDEMIG